MQRLRNQPLVRPWALSGPIVILIICLPLLRPLRHPGPQQISDSESATLATIEAVGNHGTLAIENTSFAATRQKVRHGIHDYSDQPPVQGALLGGCYWLLRHVGGLSFTRNAVLLTYLLTLIGVTLPVALSAGLIYRMGRLFELSRPWRAALGLAAVLASGLVSYAVVLNPHAPAAALVLASTTCLAYLAFCRSPLRSGGWIAMAGFFAGLAAVVDPGAGVFLVLLVLVILAMRWPLTYRIGGALMYVLGALPPLTLHVALMATMNSGAPPAWSQQLPTLSSPAHLAGVASGASRTAALAWGGNMRQSASSLSPDDDDTGGADMGEWDSLWSVAGRNVGRLVAALLGSHGLLSHFPVLILAIAGMSMVMHRHWPAATKVLAAVTLAGSAVLLLASSLHPTTPDTEGPAGAIAMFGSRTSVVFLPLLLFWAGPWLRERHHPLTWSIAGVLLAFSVVVSLIGSTYPCPPDGYRGYSPVAVLRQLAHSPKAGDARAMAER